VRTSEKHKAVTLHDVATTAGVSVSTASRAMNNSQLVEDATRRRVLSVASRIGYRPKQIRRSAERAIFNIMLVIPHRRDSALELFYAPTEFISSVNHGLGDIRRNLIVALEDEIDGFFQHKKLGDLDGCVFAYCYPGEAVRGILEKNRIPWVLVNRVVAGANFIAIDNESSMELLVKTIAGLQQQFRPVFLSHTLIRSVSSARRRGFDKAVKALGIAEDACDVVKVKSLDAVNPDLVHAIRERNPSVVFCMNDVFAVRFYEAALVSGIKVPQQMAIVGIDDSPIRKALSTPIDTVTFRHVDMGYEAGAWLASTITERTSEPIRRLITGVYERGRTVVP
jgi:LacI family transcriptional regulator